MKTLLLLALLLPAAALAGLFGSDVPKKIEVTAPAVFQETGRVKYLVVSDKAQKFQFALTVEGANGKPVALIPVQLVEKQEYTFEIEKEDLGGKSGSAIPRLVKVSQDGKVIFDREICELHRRKMRSQSVRIIYGFPMRNPKDPKFEEEAALFPHRLKPLLGGCVVGEKKSEDILVCPDCDAAYERWLKAKQ